MKLMINYVFSLLISTLALNGQTSDLILTKKDNNIWFDSVTVLPIDKQIIFIKKRILQDTLVYNAKQLRSDVVVIQNLKKERIVKEQGFISEGRILYFIRYQYKALKKYKFIDFKWNNWTESSDISKFHNFLSLTKVSKIEFITDEDKERALFGSRAGFGVIIFDLTKKKYLMEYIKLFNK